MRTWFTLALRNLFKNRRRSLFTIIAIAMGYAAINIFGGFTQYIFSSLQDSYIYMQGNGHLSIYRQGYLETNNSESGEYLLTAAEQQIVDEVASGLSEVELTTKQLLFNGLLSNGDISTIFVAVGRVPEDTQTIRGLAPGRLKEIKVYEGKPLDSGVMYGIGISTGLAEMLNVSLSDNVIAMAPTLAGQINAMDGEVFNTFVSPSEALDDKLIYVPLEFAQSLYDVDAVTLVSVLLREGADAGLAAARFNQAFREHGLQLDVRTWEEQSTFYRNVRAMFNIIFLFIFVIVLIIVVMSIINTISMTVLERIREIGTLRSLGMKRRDIVGLFSTESLLLGFVGALVGIGLTGIAWITIYTIQPVWTPPQIAQEVPLEIYLVPRFLATSLVIMLTISVATAILPALRAGKMAIIDALGHN